jgi:hypothetical protein
MAPVKPLGTGNYSFGQISPGTSSGGQFGNPAAMTYNKAAKAVKAPAALKPKPPIPVGSVRDDIGKRPPMPTGGNSPDRRELEKMMEAIRGGDAKIAKPKPKAPSWTDADFLTVDRDLKRAMAEYMARQKTEKTRAQLDFGEANREMDQQKDQDLESIREDFAARGILNSGVYGTRVGDYNAEFNENVASLARRFNDQMIDFEDALRMFQSEQDSTLEAAKQAAIRRRAEALANKPAKPKKPKQGTSSTTNPQGTSSTTNQNTSSTKKPKPRNEFGVVKLPGPKGRR